MYILHSKWFSSYSKSPKFRDLLCFFALLLPFLQVTEEVKCFVLSPLIHDTNPWFLTSLYYLLCVWHLFLLIMNSWRVEFIVLNLSSWGRFYLSCAKFVIHFSCVIITIWQLLNVQVEVEFKIISLFWSAASVSLVHRNPLCEHCSLVDQGVLEGNAPSAIKWSIALGVEFWAQHPPRTQTQPVFSPSVD